MSSNNSTTETSSQQHSSLQPQQLQQHQPHTSLPTPQQFRAISRNNSNASTTSSARGEFSSTLSTTNSVTSSRSQLASKAHQLLATCSNAGASSTPIRSFQRATISSVVKTRAFDHNPVLKGLLASASPSRNNSASNSQTPSPLSTPVFSRSRSLRMSGGPRGHQQSLVNETQAKLLELSSERSELLESLEFLECERQVSIDSAKALRETLQNERAQWKREQDELRKHLTDAIAARVRAESQLTRLEVDTDDTRTQFKTLNDELQSKMKQIDQLNKNLETAQNDLKEQRLLNEELKKMLSEKLRYNGSTSLSNIAGSDEKFQLSSDCISIVTEMARLRLELNEKDKIIANFNSMSTGCNETKQEGTSSLNEVDNQKIVYDVETLNKFLDQTVECMKSWPEELAGSSHVQNLMKTLLSAYRPDQDELTTRFQNIHL